MSIKKNVKILHEYLDNIRDIVGRDERDSDESYFVGHDSELRLEKSKKTPMCYLKTGMGVDHTLFPICNQSGATDPKMIELSKKLANDMLERNELTNIQADVIKVQLERIKNKIDVSDFVD